MSDRWTDMEELLFFRFVYTNINEVCPMRTPAGFVYNARNNIALQRFVDEATANPDFGKEITLPRGKPLDVGLYL